MVCNLGFPEVSMSGKLCMHVGESLMLMLNSRKMMMLGPPRMSGACVWVALGSFVSSFIHSFIPSSDTFEYLCRPLWEVLAFSKGQTLLLPFLEPTVLAGKQAVKQSCPPYHWITVLGGKDPGATVKDTVMRVEG